jgi:cytochrome c553
MRLATAALLVLIPSVVVAADTLPNWAFLSRTPGIPEGPEDKQPRHRPGSDKAYTQAQIDDIFNPPDWYPNEHPPMPQLVAHGKAPVVHGCAQCHLTTGRGHPESANLAGLPAGYIEEQIAEFRNGTRTSSLPANSIMITMSKELSEDEVKPAAEYFQTGGLDESGRNGRRAKELCRRRQYAVCLSRWTKRTARAAHS